MRFCVNVEPDWATPIAGPRKLSGHGGQGCPQGGVRAVDNHAVRGAVRIITEPDASRPSERLQ